MGAASGKVPFLTSDIKRLHATDNEPKPSLTSQVAISHTITCKAIGSSGLTIQVSSPLALTPAVILERPIPARVVNTGNNEAI